MFIMSVVYNFSAGVLVQCDSSIKAIIMRINTEHNHEFIIEDIDDEHILVKSQRHDDLKRLLKDVWQLPAPLFILYARLQRSQALKDTVKEPEESSESE